MSEIGLVSAQDVERLDDRQLNDLLNHLIRLELKAMRAEGVRFYGVGSPAISVADAGLDSKVEISRTPVTSRFVPSELVGYQYKAGDIPPREAAKHFCDSKGKLKPLVADLLKKRGTYVLACGRAYTEKQLKARLAKMQEAARRLLRRKTDLPLDIIGAEQIASWAANYVSAIAFVAKSARRPWLDILQPIREVAALPQYSNKYVPLKQSPEIINVVSAVVLGDQRAARIDGSPGLGKTRLILESVKPYVDNGYSIAYVDAAFASENGSELGQLALALKRDDAKGILIIDNCRAELHAMIESHMAGTSLRLISIDYRKDDIYGVGRYVFQKAENEEISEILRGIAPLVEPDLSRAVEYCDGWPLIAYRLGNLVRERGTLEGIRLSDLSDAQITRRLLGLEPTQNTELDVISALSLFNEVGFDEERADELETVRQTFVPEIARKDFIRACAHFNKNGILEIIGRYYRVTPPPLAARLVERWLETYRTEWRRIFANDLPESLSSAMALRFELLGEIREATSLAQQFLDQITPFDYAEVLGTKRGARIFRSLCALNPKSGLDALERVFAIVSQEELLNYREGRRDTIYSIDRLVIDAATFPRAMRLLLRLALAENETYSNNATGELIKRFNPISGETYASPEQRLELLDELLLSSNPDTVALGVKALGSALDSPQVVRLRSEVSHEHARVAEPAKYRHEIIQRLVSIVLNDANSEATVAAEAILQRRVRNLIARGYLFDLEDAIKAIVKRRGVNSGVYRELQFALQHDVPRMRNAEDVEEPLRRLLDALHPKTLPDRILDAITLPITSERYGDVSDLEMLAAEVVAKGALSDLLTLLSSANAYRALDFGRCLMAAGMDLESYLEQQANAFRHIPEQNRNVALLAGVLQYLKSHKLDERLDAALRRVVDEGLVLHRIGSLIASLPPDDSDVEFLLQTLRAKLASADQVAVFAYGRSLERIAPSVIKDLVQFAAKNGASMQAYFVLHMLTSNDPDLFDQYKSDMTDSILLANLDDLTQESFVSYAFMEDLERLAAQPKFAREMTQRIVQRVKENPFSLGFKNGELLAAIWRSGGYLESFRIFASAYASADERGKLALLYSTQYFPHGAVEDDTALSVLPQDFLINWLTAREDVAAVFYANHAKLIDVDAPDPEDNIMALPIMYELLRRFSDNEDVLDAILANIQSFLSVGPRTPYIERRLAFVESLPDFGSPAIRRWKLSAMQQLAHRLAAQSKIDEEHARGVH